MCFFLSSTVVQSLGMWCSRSFSGAADERFSHLHLCDAIYETFDFFVNYANAHGAQTRPDAGLIMLGLVDRNRTLQGALSVLHVILWKFVLIAFTRVDTEGITYVPVNVWLQAVRRFMRNVRAKDAKEKHRQQRAHGATQVSRANN